MIKAALYSELSGNAGLAALVGSRIYPFAAPAGTAQLGPWITYTRSNSAHEQHLNGSAGLAEQTVFIDCWATDGVRLEVLSEAIRRLLNGRVNASLGSGNFAATVSAIRLVSQADEVVEIDDADVRVRYHTRMTFTIEHRED